MAVILQSLCWSLALRRTLPSEERQKHAPLPLRSPVITDHDPRDEAAPINQVGEAPLISQAGEATSMSIRLPRKQVVQWTELLQEVNLFEAVEWNRRTGDRVVSITSEPDRALQCEILVQ